MNDRVEHPWKLHVDHILEVHGGFYTFDDIVAAVKKNGVPVEYIVFADEGHGFTKKKNQIEGYSAMLKFLDTHLKSPGTR